MVFLLIPFFAHITYAINYEISDIDPYFLGSFFVNAIFLGLGFSFVFQAIENSRVKKRLANAIILLFFLLPLILLKRNYREADRSRNFFAYDFASNVMRSVKKDAILFTNVFDHYSPWLYLRFIELKRPDVRYLDTQLCRLSWYSNYVRQNYGELYRTSEEEIHRFLLRVIPYEEGHPYNPRVIQRAYINMLNSFLTRNFKGKPVYDGMIGGPRIGRDFLRIPEGLVFSFRDSLRYYPCEFPNFELRGVLDESIYKDDRTLYNLKRYRLMVELRMKYLSEFKREKEAEALRRRYEALLTTPIL